MQDDDIADTDITVAVQVARTLRNSVRVEHFLLLYKLGCRRVNLCFQRETIAAYGLCFCQTLQV